MLSLLTNTTSLLYHPKLRLYSTDIDTRYPQSPSKRKAKRRRSKAFPATSTGLLNVREHAEKAYREEHDCADNPKHAVL